jgi:hypothetical protein
VVVTETGDLDDMGEVVMIYHNKSSALSFSLMSDIRYLGLKISLLKI